MDNITIYLLAILFLILLMFNKSCAQIDKLCYDIIDSNEFDCLNNVFKYKEHIYRETININSNPTINVQWYNWPQKQLYTGINTWKIVPFFAFNKWITINCKLCPYLTKFLKSISNLKTASLSKLSANTKINPHRGWGSMSNDSIRCYLPIIVPPNCYISVSDGPNPPLWDQSEVKIQEYPNDFICTIDNVTEEIRYHKKFEWIIIDDAKTHYAENMSDQERVILIIDIERPCNIKKGNSPLGNVDELNIITQYYKNST